jgi:hypothetical protein
MPLLAMLNGILCITPFKVNVNKHNFPPKLIFQIHYLIHNIKEILQWWKISLGFRIVSILCPSALIWNTNI